MTMRCACVSVFVLLGSGSWAPAASGENASGRLLNKDSRFRLVRAEAGSKSVGHAERALDGDPKTEFTFGWANGGGALVLDLGRACVLTSVRVTNGQANRLVWLDEVRIGPDAEHLRGLLGRSVNLAMWQAGAVTTIPVPPSVGRFVRIEFRGGSGDGAIGDVELFGFENRPERHLMCWSGDIERDFLEKLDYFDRDLGVTDLWLDFVETAFPQTNHNSGFDLWVESGALEGFRKRGIRYWLAEHEAFTFLVNGPEDLRDERRWLTTLRQARHVYARAKALGFRGLVLDAEDYGGVTKAAEAKYQEVADHVDAWCFADEFGVSGMYYHRGREYGQVLKEAWDCPLIQVYEARMYAGKPDCRAGNYWWLKGIHDSGVEIWIATEKTYGAGKLEIGSDSPAHCRQWFVRLPEFMPKVHEAYPFAARVLPGFHPWNTRIKQPNYLPRYLDEQLDAARDCARGYWIYCEGNARAGDPRDVLDRAFCKKCDVTPEQYLAVLARHQTCRSSP
ncbi:MAG: discoidin domain-containing protein [Phycisphaerae bacterium]|nr:discoidin domain-containing protein [Phycisphaerae bacterium]